MTKNCEIKKVFLYLGMAFVIHLISGCGATEPVMEEPECRPASEENCEVKDEKDRGYDPCLINKNLPVCK